MGMIFDAIDYFGARGKAGTDRKNFLEGIGSLKQVAGSDIPAGEAATGAAQKYDLSILSGDPAAQAAAIAPITNAASAQTEAEKQRLSSEGTARGGGVNEALQKTADVGTKTSVDALTALAPQAAQQVGALGLGRTGLGVNAAGTEADLSLNSRQQNLNEQHIAEKAVEDAITAMLDPSGGLMKKLGA